jgi:hypothetical protein
MHIYIEIKASIPINENTTHPAERVSILPEQHTYCCAFRIAVTPHTLLEGQNKKQRNWQGCKQITGQTIRLHQCVTEKPAPDENHVKSANRVKMRHQPRIRAPYFLVLPPEMLSVPLK